jgi:hypothetical protein
VVVGGAIVRTKSFGFYRNVTKHVRKGELATALSPSLPTIMAEDSKLPPIPAGSFVVLVEPHLLTQDSERESTAAALIDRKADQARHDELVARICKAYSGAKDGDGKSKQVSAPYFTVANISPLEELKLTVKPKTLSKDEAINEWVRNAAQGAGRVKNEQAIECAKHMTAKLVNVWKAQKKHCEEAEAKKQAPKGLLVVLDARDLQADGNVAGLRLLDCSSLTSMVYNSRHHATGVVMCVRSIKDLLPKFRESVDRIVMAEPVCKEQAALLDDLLMSPLWI